MKKLDLLRVALFVLGLALCGFGLWRGEMSTVQIKGSNICLECIGLG